MMNLDVIAAPGDNNASAGTVYVNYTAQSILVIPLSAVDDNTLNLNKILHVEISLQNREDRNCVLLQPNVANITITDDDGEIMKMKMTI